MNNLNVVIGMIVLAIIMFFIVAKIFVSFAKWNGWKDGSYLNRP